MTIEPTMFVNGEVRLFGLPVFVKSLSARFGCGTAEIACSSCCKTILDYVSTGSADQKAVRADLRLNLPTECPFCGTMLRALPCLEESKEHEAPERTRILTKADFFGVRPWPAYPDPEKFMVYIQPKPNYEGFARAILGRCRKCPCREPCVEIQKKTQYGHWLDGSPDCTSVLAEHFNIEESKESEESDEAEAKTSDN